MYRLAVLFLCVALVAAVLSLGGTSYSGEGAEILFFLFLALSAMCFASGWLNRPAPDLRRRR